MCELRIALGAKIKLLTYLGMKRDQCEAFRAAMSDHLGVDMLDVLHDHVRGL